jgi:hypothetical protein
MLEMRTFYPRYLHFGMNTLVGCSVVTNVTLLDMAGLNVVLSGIAWLRMGLGNMGLLSVGLVNRLGMLLDVMLLAALLNLVEGSSNSMHESAKNSENKSTPGQVAAVIRSVGIILENTRNTLCLITSSWTSWTTIGSSENRHSNETSNKGNIQKNPEPAKPSWTTTLEKQRHDHADKSVQGSGSENTLNRTKGSVDATSGLDDIDDVVDFLETSGEKAEGDDR